MQKTRTTLVTIKRRLDLYIVCLIRALIIG